jgi:hypothetical protein
MNQGNTNNINNVETVIGVDVYIDVYPKHQDSAAWVMSMLAADSSFNSIYEVQAKPSILKSSIT